MIIVICGPAGSGKSTISKIIAKKLGYKHYSMGDMRRMLASKRGMSLGEFNKFGETDPITDTEVDEFQKKMGEAEDNFVVDGRTSFHFIPHAIKIYLDADLKVRAQRELKLHKMVEKYRNLDDAIRGIEERDISDVKRYKKYYNLDVADKKHYDLIIDTTEITVEETVKRIMDFINNY